MANIAHGPEEIFTDLLFEQGVTSNALNLVFSGIKSESIELLQICVWLVSNVMAESAEVGKFIVTNSDLI